MIEAYEFGEITIGGRKYRRDVIVTPEGVIDGWWREEGHRLRVSDLSEALKARPEVLVVGTGYYGCMKVDEEVLEELGRMGVEVIVQNTREAWRTYNEVSRGRRAVAALHLTC